VTDPEGAIASSNAAAIRLLGGPVATLDQLLARLLDPDGDRPRALAPDPSEYRLAGRPTAWVEVAAYPVAGSGEQRVSTVVVCRDVSAFRQGQALREAFLGLLSHELRTPVTTIYGGSAVLARPGSTLDGATRDEILADIAGEADRLYRLVEDLMVLARFDEGIEIGNEPALLQRLVPSVVEQERGRWPATTFTVDARSDLPAVGGDETSITQVTRNLLSNAAKYGGLDGTVTVIIEPGDDGVVVRVRDDGPGINPAEADDLFSPFFRSQTTARMAAGAGIGLHVSRRLVDAMGGRIWAKRLDDRGSEFGFLIPRYRGLPDD
jgi:signal transduction histidine kinase